MRKLIFLLLLAALFSAEDINAQLIQVVSGTTNGIGCVKQYNGQVYFLGNNYFSKTGDMGMTIQSLNVPLPPPNDFPPNNNNLARALNITNTDIYLIIGKNPSWIIHSGNDGINWDTIFFVPPWYPSSLSDFNINKDGVMLTAGSFGKVFRTIDGMSWDTLYNTGMVHQDKCLILSDSIYLIGAQGKTLKSSKLGSVWGWKQGFIGNLSAYCNAMQIINGDTIYMVSYYIPTSGELETYFSKSFDGGESWNTITVGYGFSIYEIEFINSSRGFAVGYDHVAKSGIILETNDAGVTWTKYKTGYNNTHTDIELLGDSIMFIVGSNGLILKSGIDSYATSVPELNTVLATVRIFPNPVKDKLLLQLGRTGETNVVVRLSNILGAHIANFRLTQKTEEIDVSHLAPAVYFLQVESADGTATYKFIKE